MLDNKKICRNILIVVLMIIVTNVADAMPAWPGTHEVSQPDGTTFKMRLCGDEYYHWWETEDGYVILQDNSDGFWKYATKDAEKDSYSVVPHAKVGAVNPADMDLVPGISLGEELLKRKIEILQSIPKVSDSTTLESYMPPCLRIPVAGNATVKNIVILAAFNDHWDSANATVLASEGRVATEEYDALFNEVGYSADGAVGSVRDYYDEVSYGKLTLNSIITPWVRLPENEMYYGQNSTDGGDMRSREMVNDAIEAAASAGFDFSQGDGDGDGWADCLTIIHSGTSEEYTDNPSYDIWSHQWQMIDVNTKNGVNMLRYHTTSALRGDGTGAGIIRVGVICHEMGHFLGLPDLYDYSHKTLGIGCWGIMASGSWNGGDGKSPAHFCAWSKYMLGLIQPIRMYSSTDIELPSTTLNAVAHLYRDGLADGEYFLLENRTNDGFDNTSRIIPGLIIYHIDENSNNNDLNVWEHPAVKIEEADGNDSLGETMYWYSEAGDVWHRNSGLSGGFRDNTGNLSTNAMSYQSGYYNRNDNPAYYSYITLNNFSLPGDVMTYDAATLRTSVSSQHSIQTDYSVSWTASSNATAYELQEGVPILLDSFTDGAESIDEMFENWNIGGNVQRSSAGKKTGVYSYVMQVFDNSRYYSSVQSMTQRTPFTLGNNTNISFYYRSNMYDNAAYLKIQVSNDSGETWHTLGNYNDLTDSWVWQSFNYNDMDALGMNTGDSCIIRFVANFENILGRTTFPVYGYAIDDISITNGAISSYGNWTTLDDEITETSYTITGKEDGQYAYRVRAYANDAWQEYGSIGVTTVTAKRHTVVFQTDGTPGAVLSGDRSQTVFAGTDCTPVTVTVPEEMELVGWMLNGSVYSTDNPLTVTNVHDDMTLVATFATQTFTLSYVAGEYGSLSGETEQTGEYGFNGTAVQAIPDLGCRFLNWSDGKTDNPRTDSNVTEDLSITAIFAQNYLTLIVMKVGEGVVLLNSEVLALPWSGEVPEFSTISLKAVPRVGHVFTGWSGDQETTSNPLSLPMDQAYIIVANFTDKETDEGEQEGEDITEGEVNEGEDINEGESELTEGEIEGESVEGEDTIEGEYPEGEDEGESSEGEGETVEGETEGEYPEGEDEGESSEGEGEPVEGEYPEGEGEILEGELIEGEGESVEGESSEGEEPGSTEDHAVSLLEAFDTADTNGDGALSYDEAYTVLSSLTLMQFDSLDTNGDETLTQEELQAIVQEKCGCGNYNSKNTKSLSDLLGDWLLVGLSLLVLLSFAFTQKH